MDFRGSDNLVSVVIPTYNRAAKVVEAVRSVLGQEQVDIEVIVIDDGSTDHTRQLIEPFLDRIRYVHKENGGVSSARNRGIREATGKWVAFLDSDDVWQPGKLRRQLECAAATDAKVCFCRSSDESGEVLDDLHRMTPSLAPGSSVHHPAGDCRLFLYPRHPFLQSMLVRRDALDSVGGFDGTLRVAEDTRLIYQLVLAFGHTVVNEPLVTICRDREEHGLSDSPDPETASLRYVCYTRVQSEVYWRLLALDPGAAKVVRANLWYFGSRLAEIRCALGQKEAARRTAWAALDVRAGARNIVRNLLILFFYQTARRRFVRKWGAAETPPPPAAEPIEQTS